MRTRIIRTFITGTGIRCGCGAPQARGLACELNHAFTPFTQEQVL
jgi:hypothetical protein